MNKSYVYFSYDGSTADFLALLALTQMENVHLSGVGLINGACYAEASGKVTRKILSRFCSYEVETALSVARAVNQFTDARRREAYSLDALPILNEMGAPTAPLAEEKAHMHMVKKIRENPGKTTILVTGPLTDVAAALHADPSLVEKIDKVIWAGGSFTDVGNVDEPNHDGSADWNAFWDPFAVKEVFSYDIPIVLVPLHAANQCCWTKEQSDCWAHLRMYPTLDLVGQFCSVAELYGHHFEDALAALYLVKPDIATAKQLCCSVQCMGAGAGYIGENKSGRMVTALDQVDSEAAFSCLTELLKKHGTYQNQR